MNQGHFHLQARTVYRSKGHSAVGAAAYQAGTHLTHHGKNLARPGTTEKKMNTLNIEEDDRHHLNAGRLPDPVRDDLAKRGILLSDEISVKELSRNHWEIRDSESGKTQDVHASAPALELHHRKALNKGMVSDALRTDLEKIGVHLTTKATAKKESQWHWVIQDGEVTYDIRQYKTRITNPLTKTREVVEKGLDVYAPRIYDYRRRKDVVCTFMRMPKYADDALKALEEKGGEVTPAEREEFWNHKEHLESRRDGRVAHTLEVALSRELTLEQNIALVHRFVEQEVLAHNRVADIAVHRKEASDGLENIHAHILYTDRELRADGNFAETKNRRWGNEEYLLKWRASWAKVLNAGLEDAGAEVRVTHESHETQGLAQLPSIHLGPIVTHMEERGIETHKGDINREITFANRMRGGKIRAGHTTKDGYKSLNQTIRRAIQMARRLYDELDRPDPNLSEKERRKRDEKDQYYER